MAAPPPLPTKLFLFFHLLLVAPCNKSCSPTGRFLHGESHSCNTEHDSYCCQTSRRYPQFHCFRPVTGHTQAAMTISSFATGGDGGAPSECDGSFHRDDELVVALSTGWYNGGRRCHKNIRINANGRSVLAKLVDECDSVSRCDADHDFQPP